MVEDNEVEGRRTPHTVGWNAIVSGASVQLSSDHPQPCTGPLDVALDESG